MQYGIRDERKQPPRVTPRKWALVPFVLLTLLGGCVSPWEKSVLLRDTSPNIDKVQGPTERRMRLIWWKKSVEQPDESDSLKPLAGTDEYLEATELYNDEQYAEAQKAFKGVAKKFKKYEIREDALFMEGECAFQLEHFSKAHDFYAKLLRDYPSTRHLDVVSERLFYIGRIWLDFPEVASLGEIKQVNFDDPKNKLPADEPPKINKTPIFRPNFTDKTRPLFDTPGNGVAALQAIWMNDPTGPLADDAMMLVASHHARKGNWVDADRYFRMLRETFPNSPHLQDAFLLGSHVKLMSYMGPDYDGKALSDAQQLKESTVRLFPKIDEADRLKAELALIEDAKAEREWKEVAYWIHKRDKRAACVACHQLLHHFPKSRYADKAREELEKLGPEYVSGAILLTPYDPKKPKIWERVLPVAQAKPRPAPPAVVEPDDEAKPAKEDQPAPRWLPNPFRKRPDATQEKPTDKPEDAPDTDHPVEEPSNQVASGSKSADKKTSRRSWFGWPAPKQLPADTDKDAKKLPENDDTGRTQVQTSNQETN